MMRTRRAAWLCGVVLTTAFLACGGSQSLRGPGPGHPGSDSSGHGVEVGPLEIAHEVNVPVDPEMPSRTQSSDIMYRDTTYHPTVFQLVIRRRIEHAAKHREEAPAFIGSESEECREVQPEQRAQCPLLESVEAVDKIEGGVRLRLAASVDPTIFMHHVRCHMLHGNAHPSPAMHVCPLYVPRVVVRPGQGSHIDILASDPAELDELIRRVEQHLMPLGPERAPAQPASAQPPAPASP